MKYPLKMPEGCPWQNLGVLLGGLASKQEKFQTHIKLGTKRLVPKRR